MKGITDAKEMLIENFSNCCIKPNKKRSVYVIETK